eukprot:1648286-Pyramimonas_sp.AAC.1
MMQFSLGGVGFNALVVGRNAQWRLGALPNRAQCPPRWAQCLIMRGRNAQWCLGAMPKRAQCHPRRAQCPPNRPQCPT